MFYDLTLDVLDRVAMMVADARHHALPLGLDQIVQPSLLSPSSTKFIVSVDA